MGRSASSASADTASGLREGDRSSIWTIPYGIYQENGSAGGALRRRGGDPLVVVDHLGDHEAEPLLGERGVEMGVLGEGTQALHLLPLPVGISRRQAVRRLELAHALSELEPLGEQVGERGVD